MADQPIGISFIPSAQNQANGPNNLRNDGGIGAGSTDLAQAYKILSLRLPSVVGAQAPVAPSLLTSQGSQGLANGMNPSAALFAALIKSMLGISSPSPMGGSMGDLFGGSPTPAPMGGSMGSQNGGAPSGGMSDFGGPPPETGRLVPKIQLPQDQSFRETPEPDYGGINNYSPQQEYKDVGY